MQNKKYLFFDLDNTITQSRQHISSEMNNVLLSLRNQNKKIIVISGAETLRIENQLEPLLAHYIMGQSGADCHLWKTVLTEKETEEILAHIAKVKKAYPDYPWESNDLIQNRGCQISLSFLGHNADLEQKKAFDPDCSIRAAILKKIPLKSKHIEVRITGTTCFDYTPKESTKGKNIARFIEAMGWAKEDCVYYGDKFMKGGNDETVIGIIDHVAVDSPEDLAIKLKKDA